MNRYRHEFKYLVDARQEALLRFRAGSVMKKDPHVREDGTYLIRSAYFDDAEDSCLRENLGGTDPRSKFRIRYYNSDTGRIQLEKKSKKRGMCLKEACAITREECEIFLEGGVPPIRPEDPEIRQALFTEVLMRGLHPVNIVTYERIPFTYSGGNVRITFDRKLSSSRELHRFLSGDYTRRPVFPLGQSLMEVKWDELLPRHIREVMQTEGLEWTAFSKYYMCRLVHQ